MTDFDKEFEAQVLANCLKDRKFMQDAARVLDRRHFALPEHAWAWKIMQSQWSRGRELATPAIFRSKVSDETGGDAERAAKLQLVLKLFKVKPDIPHSSLEELKRFVRTAQLQSAIEESVKFQEKGQWDEAWNPIRSAVREDVGRSEYAMSNWAMEFQDRQQKRKHRKDNPGLYRSIPTGFKALDRVITGAQEGELCGIMATTNRGKSILAVNIGFAALVRGFGVVHFSTEMGHEKVAQRYDSRLTRFEYRKFKRYKFTKDELEQADKVFALAEKRFRDRLRIISTPLRACDIDMIRGAIEDLKPQMSKLDLVIVDSGDHLQARGRHEKAYLAESSNYWDLKDLAEGMGMPIWVTMQAAREWESKIASTQAAAGSYDKARICDIILSINETIGKRRPNNRKTGVKAVTIVGKDGAKDGAKDKSTASDGKNLPLLKLYVAKNRDDASRMFIPIEPDFATMTILEGDEDDNDSEDRQDDEEDETDV